jgi:hypothetical protein
VFTPEQIMVQEMRPPSPVLVWDGDGGPVGVGIAEMLAAFGGSVSLATRYDRVAPLLDATFEGAGVRTRLHDLQVETIPGVVPIAATDRGVLFKGPFGAEKELPASSLVLVAQRRSNDALFHSLSTDSRLGPARIEDVLRIGDCVAPRHFGLAINDGHRAGREIEDPTVDRSIRPVRERDGDIHVASFTWPAGVSTAAVDAS